MLDERSLYILIPGFRTQQVSLITTLLNTNTYSTLELVQLYNERSDVELHLKHLKNTLGMDILRGKTPDIVRKEIYVYLLACNLLRTLMWEAGTIYGVPPRRFLVKKLPQADKILLVLLSIKEQEVGKLESTGAVTKPIAD